MILTPQNVLETLPRIGQPEETRFRTTKKERGERESIGIKCVVRERAYVCVYVNASCVTVWLGEEQNGCANKCVGNSYLGLSSVGNAFGSWRAFALGRSSLSYTHIIATFWDSIHIQLKKPSSISYLLGQQFDFQISFSADATLIACAIVHREPAAHTPEGQQKRE